MDAIPAATSPSPRKTACRQRAAAKPSSAATPREKVMAKSPRALSRSLAAAARKKSASGNATAPSMTEVTYSYPQRHFAATAAKTAMQHKTRQRRLPSPLSVHKSPAAMGRNQVNSAQ